MRLPLAAIAVLVLAAGGCTVRHADGGRRATTAEDVAPAGTAHAKRTRLAPIFPDARPVVWCAAERAAFGYFGHVDDEDAAAGRLHVIDHNGWYGDSDVVITLTPAEDGATRVSIEVERLAIEWLQDREHGIIDRYLARLDVEMRTVRGLRAALADQAPTVAASATGADGSATSRP